MQIATFRASRTSRARVSSPMRNRLTRSGSLLRKLCSLSCPITTVWTRLRTFSNQRAYWNAPPQLDVQLEKVCWPYFRRRECISRSNPCSKGRVLEGHSSVYVGNFASLVTRIPYAFPPKSEKGSLYVANRHRTRNEKAKPG